MGFSPDDLMRKWEAWGFGGQKTKPLPTSYAKVSISFVDSCLGVNREIVYDVNRTCVSCDGVGAKSGNFNICKKCKGSGHQIVNQGMQLNVTACGGCSGQGYIITKKCTGCKGKKTKASIEKQQITLPSGISNQMNYNVKTKDGGNVVVSVHVQSHPSMQRQVGHIDVHSEAKISLKDSLLGCKIEVETVHGLKIVTLKECTQSEAKIRLKGCGAKHPYNTEFGSHIVHVVVKYPEKLTEEQRDKIKEVFND